MLVSDDMVMKRPLPNGFVWIVGMDFLGDGHLILADHSGDIGYSVFDVAWGYGNNGMNRFGMTTYLSIVRFG